MSARTEPCSEFVILTTTLSLSYALRILFLYRVLYVFKGLLAHPFHFLFKTSCMMFNYYEHIPLLPYNNHQRGTVVVFLHQSYFPCVYVSLRTR